MSVGRLVIINIIKLSSMDVIHDKKQVRVHLMEVVVMVVVRLEGRPCYQAQDRHPVLLLEYGALHMMENGGVR